MFKKFAALAALLSLVSLLSLFAIAHQPKQVNKPLEKSATKKKTDQTADDKKADAPEPIIVRAQLPRLWSKLGLTDQQRKQIYRVRATYAVKMEKLKKEMEELRLKEIADTEAILTENQRSRLKELRSGTEGKK